MNGVTIGRAWPSFGGPVTKLASDLVVVHLDDVGDAKFTVPPLLVVEVRSPSTALIDLNRKKAAYEKFGVRRTGSWTSNRPGPS
jgi:Uma2 family endonuclease